MKVTVDICDPCTEARLQAYNGADFHGLPQTDEWKVWFTVTSPEEFVIPAHACRGGGDCDCPLLNEQACVDEGTHTEGGQWTTN